MGEMITKPDANPIIFAVCNLFLCGALGYFLMGQQSKATKSAIIWVVFLFLNFCTFGLTGMGMMALQLVTAYDAYLLGQKLQSGESIGMNENGLDFLNSIFKD